MKVNELPIDASPDDIDGFSITIGKTDMISSLSNFSIHFSPYYFCVILSWFHDSVACTQTPLICEFIKLVATALHETHRHPPFYFCLLSTVRLIYGCSSSGKGLLIFLRFVPVSREKKPSLCARFYLMTPVILLL